MADQETKQFLYFLKAKRKELVEKSASADEGPSDADLARIVLYHQAIEATQQVVDRDNK